MYQVEQSGDIVISGFEQGIGDSPYAGLTDLKSVDIGSTPGEVSTTFSTQSVTQTKSYTNQTITADGAGNLQITVSGSQGDFLENGQAIYVSASTISGFTQATYYYIIASSNQGSGVEKFSVTSLAYGTTATLTVGNTGTATYSTVDVARPKFFVTSSNGESGTNFLLDSSGRLWSDTHPTTGGTSINSTSSWTYAGNTVAADSNGNGLVYWRANGSLTGGGIPGDFDGWLFIFRDGFIDYSNVNGRNAGTNYNHTGTYTYGWNPATGSTTGTGYLNGQAISACPHNAIVGPNGVLFFCDSYSIKSIQQADTLTPTAFNPSTPSTYFYNNAYPIPINEIATCIAPLGLDYIIGGRGSQAYVWNGLDAQGFTNPILLAESYVTNIVTVNTNAYIFCGNRGNIYVTNGAQANPWKKIPDHLSGTIQPYFTWGGATFLKNKIYFGVYATNNAGTALTGYGGLWCVDVDTGAMSLSNQLSYATYAGYPTALLSIPPIPNFPTGNPTQPTGVGLFIGWSPDGSSTSCGIDKTIGTPYSSNQSYVVSELIPVGTLLKPTAALQLEYKLSTPLLSTETIQLLANSTLNGTFTSAGTTSGTTAATIISDNFPNPLGAVQWMSVKAIMNSRNVSPSYCRIKEIRIVSK